MDMLMTLNIGCYEDEESDLLDGDTVTFDGDADVTFDGDADVTW